MYIQRKLNSQLFSDSGHQIIYRMASEFSNPLVLGQVKFEKNSRMFEAVIVHDRLY